MKERITITIATDLLEEIDNKVDGTTIKNRSHAIELFLAKSLQRQSVSQAVILAGGPEEIEIERKRVHAPMVIINKKPVLEHIIYMLKRQGINQIIISVGHKKDDIMQHFGDGSHFGITINYVEEDEPLGTAGALKKASEYITNTFVVCNGDELKDIDVRDMLDFNRKQGSSATLALTTVSDAKDYGVVILNGNKVYRFIEKPTGNIPSNLISAGLYLFEPEMLNNIPEGYARLEEDVFPKLAQSEDLSGFVFYGKWQDIRSKEGYEKARQQWEGF